MPKISTLSSAPVQMRSREIAEITGKEHKHVRRDIESMFIDLNLDKSNYGLTYYDKLNREQKEYSLDRELTYVLLTGYSATLRLAVIRRLDELESLRAKPKMPNFNDPAEMAIAWAEEYRKSQTLAIENNSKQQLLDKAAPKIEFVDKYTDSDSLFGFRQVAKLLNIKEASLRAFLVRRKIMYNLSGTWMAYQPHIDNKYFSVKTGLYAANKSFATCMFTTKGLYYIHKLMSKESLEVNLALMD